MEETPHPTLETIRAHSVNDHGHTAEYARAEKAEILLHMHERSHKMFSTHKVQHIHQSHPEEG